MNRFEEIPQQKPAEVNKKENENKADLKLEKLKSVCDDPKFQELLPEYIENEKDKKLEVNEPLVHGTGSFALKRIIEQGFVPQRGGELLHGEKVTHHTNAEKEEVNPISLTTEDETGEMIGHWYALLATKGSQLQFNSDKFLDKRLTRILNEVYGGTDTATELRLKGEIDLLIKTKEPNLTQAVEISKQELIKDFEQKLIDRSREGANVFDVDFVKNKIEKLNLLLDQKIKDADQVEEILRENNLLESFRHYFAPRGERLPICKTREITQRLLENRQEDSWVYDEIRKIRDILQGKVDNYNNLSEQERKEIDNQFPCFITIESEKLELKDKSERMHDKVRELVSDSVIEKERIKEIQVPKSKIEEVQKWLKEFKLENVRMIPFEYYEMRQVIEHSPAE
ncbi:MAG: hypothetical protein V1686_00960 [Patescibacteria group bacterium]